jgi:hypothetical protein
MSLRGLGAGGGVTHALVAPGAPPLREIRAHQGSVVTARVDSGKAKRMGKTCVCGYPSSAGQGRTRSSGPPGDLLQPEAAESWNLRRAAVLGEWA